ncbi:MAG: HD domain-containing protein [Candidatus Omnitrophica bacterium]|nr:HD domain-containing protein [Candidatus Omnitrophota bacterium]
MVHKPLLLKLFEAASMQRWNDQIRTVELTELDKQAHKMIIAFVLGKFEEDLGTSDEFDWIQIIEAGIFEYLQRTVLTDLKPPLFHRIKEDWDKYVQLNQWAYERIHEVIAPLGPDFCTRFRDYLLDRERNVNRRIISAAHFYATKWEFDIIERANPAGYGIGEIRRDIRSKQEKYGDLKSMQQFLFSQKLRHFVNICGQLRFQVRWSHLHRVPRTAVLGHMLLVAMLTYLFSLQVNANREQCANNYFTGLFHDLPEVLTRDVINPVKRSVEGLSDIIKEYEREEMENKIYTLIPERWQAQLRMYTESEFTDLKDEKGEMYKSGSLVKAVDNLCAFVEAYLSVKNGIQNEDLFEAMQNVTSQYWAGEVCGVSFAHLFQEFS